MRSWRRDWVLFSALLALIGVLYVGFREVADNQAVVARVQTNSANIERSLRCVTDWANDYAATAARLRELDQQRLDALDTLARALATDKRQADVLAAVRAYLASSDAYRQAQREHPIPPPLALQCHLAGVITLPGPSRTVTTTAPGPTRTVTSTVPRVTSTVTRPGPTVTRPGPTRTVTRPRPTVTVTRPACLPLPGTHACLPHGVN